MVWDRVTGITSNPFQLAVSHRRQILGLFGGLLDTALSLPLSYSGHKISLIKWTFVLFAALVFFLKIETFFINCTISGTFISTPISSWLTKIISSFHSM